MSTCLQTVPVYGQVVYTTPDYNSSARSNAQFWGDLWFGFEVTRASVSVVAGLNDVDVDVTPYDIDHAFHFQRGTYSVVENGQIVGPFNVPYTEGDRFYIARIGTQVIYMLRPVSTGVNDYFTDPGYPNYQLPGYIVYESAKPSTGLAFLDTALYHEDDTIRCEAAGVTWYPGADSQTLAVTAGGANLSLPYVMTGTVSAATGGTPSGVLASYGGGELPYTVDGYITDQFTPAVTTYGVAEIPYTATGSITDTAIGSLSSWANLEYGYIVAGSTTDISSTLNTYALLELPYALSAGGSSPTTAANSFALLDIPFAVQGSITDTSIGSLNTYASLELPFTLAASTSFVGQGTLTSYAMLELPYAMGSTTLSTISTVEGANLELPYSLLMSDQDLQSLLIGELPYDLNAATSVNGGGGFLYPVPEGISAPLIYSVSGGTFSQNNSLSGELPFVAFGTTGFSGSLRSAGFVDIPYAVAMASSGGSDIVVDDGYGLLELPYIVAATGSSPTDVVADTYALLEVPYDLFGTTTPDTSPPIVALGYAPITYDVDAVGTDPSQSNYFLIRLTFTADADTPGPIDDTEILDVFYAVTSVLPIYANHVYEPIQIGSVVQTFYNPTVNIVDEAYAVATHQTSLAMAVAEVINTVDNLSFVQAVKLAEQLAAAGVAETTYHGLVEIVAAILVSDQVGDAFAHKVTDSVTISDSATQLAKLFATQLDAINVASTMQNILTIAVEETAELQAADSYELTSTLLAELIDSVDVYTLFTTTDEVAQAWVMNTEGSRPISEYDNYSFNSMTYFRGKMYGANDSGLWELDGDDDAGTPITAEIESMMLDFGTSRMKRIRTAYLGYTSTNELVLKVQAVDQGQLFEHWYKAEAVDNADAPRANMVRVGQGLRSRYWQFQLTNIDGGDFEIDQLELYPLILNRRV